MTSIRPFLMCQGGVAAQAIELYIGTFDGAVVSSVPSSPRCRTATRPRGSSSRSSNSRASGCW
ncbi:hypothetical protein [Tsukamurella sp. PLM1]|uniref:hypothetical protein n=1 Tax=Tsukamurella sp. PLM1 TaxID=2929795 RepID=UPI0020C02A99|nr:hypothetical protein [Tsukamurella sp. PLM1]